jgi:hypothetical protein|tara:strand:- start:298 stop:612 length:315 start_codon:yes stop_codon:yes gene_type:complete
MSKVKAKAKAKAKVQLKCVSIFYKKLSQAGSFKNFVKWWVLAVLLFDNIYTPTSKNTDKVKNRNLQLYYPLHLNLTFGWVDSIYLRYCIETTNFTIINGLKSLH